jgi:hypothetical protein
MQNLLLEIPYKFKKSYGGTPEPQTTQDAPWLREPSLRIGQDFNMSHRCDMLGSLLPRWTSGYDINLITMVFLDQIARVAQWTTRLPYLKMRTSRSGMSRTRLLSNLGTVWGNMSHRCDMLFL